jgi:galactofuranosylgalactofuranosylrhamnosyl-N-acetylglucosaminyl-diphospho-decaprenol beta-1,5/1,6-galactofuranosyltransferase
MTSVRFPLLSPSLTERHSLVPVAVSLHPSDWADLSGYFSLLPLEPLSHVESKRLVIALEASVRIVDPAADDSLTTLRSTLNLSFVHLADGAERTLRADAIDLDSKPDGTFGLRATLPKPESANELRGLVFVRLNSLSTSVQLSDLSWVVTDLSAERQTPRLGLVCCTFNRPNDIKRTLAAIQNSAAFREGRAVVRVVDNASNLERSEIETNSSIRLISQSNLGGAGGFTRGLVDLVERKDLTHFLFMDDDIILSPPVLDRLMGWLTLLPDAVPVSGAMLDLHRPSDLFEAGGRFISMTYENQADYSQIDLSAQAESATRLAKSSNTDYGAWWFFAFSRKTVESVGLPLPVFIRGDDVEYGIRLKHKGFRTQVIHGIAVWHEPFYAKRSYWTTYYSVRNFSVINTVHFDASPGQYIMRTLKLALQFMLRYDYGTAAAIELGFRDFLHGPELILDSGATTHQRVLASLSPYTHQTAERPDTRLEVTLRSDVRSSLVAPIGLAGRVKQLLRGVHLLPSSQIAPPQVIESAYVSWRWLFSDRFVQLLPGHDRGPLYTRDNIRFWHLVLRCTVTFCILAPLRFSVARARFRQSHAELSTVSSWQRYFAQAEAAAQNAARRGGP